MYLLTYLLVLSVFGLIALFVFQLWQLRAGRIERLPNITGAHVVGPLARFLARWVVLVRKQVQVFSYPLLMVFYQGLLQLLHRLTSRIGNRFNYIADTIKGKTASERHF